MSVEEMIDRAIEDNTVSGDAMRWDPDRSGPSRLSPEEYRRETVAFAVMIRRMLRSEGVDQGGC